MKTTRFRIAPLIGVCLCSLCLNLPSQDMEQAWGKDVRTNFFWNAVPTDFLQTICGPKSVVLRFGDINGFAGDRIITLIFPNGLVIDEKGELGFAIISKASSLETTSVLVRLKKDNQIENAIFKWSKLIEDLTTALPLVDGPFKDWARGDDMGTLVIELAVPGKLRGRSYDHPQAYPDEADLLGMWIGIFANYKFDFGSLKRNLEREPAFFPMYLPEP